jgi:hypothetical protein
MTSSHGYPIPVYYGASGSSVLQLGKLTPLALAERIIDHKTLRGYLTEDPLKCMRETMQKSGSGE